jgi:Protein of unknown function (DUF1194)
MKRTSLPLLRRRDLIALLGGAAAWPLAARAQQPDQMRRIGVLLPAAADDSEWQARVGAFLQALALLGWTIGRNVRAPYKAHRRVIDVSGDGDNNSGREPTAAAGCGDRQGHHDAEG